MSTVDLFGNDDSNEEGEDVYVPRLLPKMDEASEQKLLAVLQSGGPGSDDWDSEVLDYLHHSDEATLPRLLTIENAQGLLTEWEGDPVNDPCGLTGLHAMASFPAEIVQHHAKGILAHADEVVGDKYGWHEDYYGLWEDVIHGLAAKHCTSALTIFVSETLLPRIREAAQDYAEACAEAKSEGERKPDLFQDELLDTAAKMGEIVLKCAAAFEPCVAELSTVLEPYWKDIEDCGVYKERLSALRSILSGKSGAKKRQATESAESKPDAKKVRKRPARSS